MGARTRDRAKGRRESGAFAPIPVSVLNHSSFKALSGKASKLLLNMIGMVNFGKGGPKNNGDISITFSLMEACAWKSKQTLRQAEVELTEAGFIVKTRQGGRNKCNLYAITWWAINECPGKGLDIPPTNAPMNCWRKGP